MIARWIEVGAHVLDEHHRHVELFLGDARASARGCQFGRRTDLIGPVQRVEDQALLMERQATEVLAIAQRDLADGDGAGLLERLAEQRIRLDADRLRLQVVRALQVDARFDLRIRAELDDLDRVRRGQGDVVEIRVGHDHVLVLADLIAAQSLAPADLSILFRAPAFVAHGRVVVGAEQPERNTFRFGRQVQPHGDRHHAKADGTPPHGSRHWTFEYRGVGSVCTRRFGAVATQVVQAAASSLSYASLSSG